MSVARTGRPISCNSVIANYGRGLPDRTLCKWARSFTIPASQDSCWHCLSGQPAPTPVRMQQTLPKTPLGKRPLATLHHAWYFVSRKSVQATALWATTPEPPRFLHVHLGGAAFRTGASRWVTHAFSGQRAVRGSGEPFGENAGIGLDDKDSSAGHDPAWNSTEMSKANQNKCGTDSGTDNKDTVHARDFSKTP